jgi:hypothetical protein
MERTMSILVDPLFSDEARGQVAKTAVFKRSAVHPVFSGYAYHPQNWTTKHRAAAAAWKTLCNSWRSLSPADQEQWNTLAPGLLTGFNYFMQNKGVLPLPPCYVQPGGHHISFDFTVTNYTPPPWDELTFQFLWCI